MASGRNLAGGRKVYILLRVQSLYKVTSKPSIVMMQWLTRLVNNNSKRERQFFYLKRTETNEQEKAMSARRLYEGIAESRENRSPSAYGKMMPKEMPDRWRDPMELVP